MSDISLKDFAYYKTGGSCEELFQPRSLEELSEKLKEISSRKQKFFVLGGGSNSLVLDDYYQGCVIHLDYFNELAVSDETEVAVGAAIENTALSRFCFEQGLDGVGWMNRLPGKLGGTARMNARCYGGEIGLIVSEVTSVGLDGTIATHRITNDRKIFRGYKDTLFMENGAIITGVKLGLKKAADLAALKKEMDHCESDRIAKGQFLKPSCGCVFKNDYSIGVPSGMLLDAADVKILNTETVYVNPQHANFVFNNGATSTEILNFTLAMRERVFDEFGAWLSYEMEILGEPPQDLSIRLGEKRKNSLNHSKIKPLKDRFASKL